MINITELAAALWSAALVTAPVEDICITPDVSNMTQNQPFVYQGLIIRAVPVMGGDLAASFPVRDIHALRVYRDVLGIVRWVPMSGTAALVPQEELDGTVQREWIATLNGMGVQPPEAIGLDPEASHGAHQFQLRIRIPATWILRRSEPNPVGDPQTQFGWAWAWNENKRWDGLGDDDFSHSWAPIWRVNCSDFIGPTMFDLVD